MSKYSLDTVDGSDPLPSRFLSSAACTALQQRAREFSAGGGETTVFLESQWAGNLRWARNRIISSGDIRNNAITVFRTLRGAQGLSSTNRIDDARLRTTVQHAERFLALQAEMPESDRRQIFIEPYSTPKIWSDVTYAQDGAERAHLMRSLVTPAVKAGMLCAGYIQVSGHGRASVTHGRTWYYPYTLARYSVTVRDPANTGSGWAGIDHNDWGQIDAEAISAIALEKCLQSRNPMRVEPGRYTAILEPQAVCDLVSFVFTPGILDRVEAEWVTGGDNGPSSYSDGKGSVFQKRSGLSKLGEKVIDDRLTVSMDPMDPDLGFPPFKGWTVFHPATWITNGVLTELRYERRYAVELLGKNTGGIETDGAFRMSVRGETASIDDMIATTKRGILVTRFSDIQVLDKQSLLMNGYTRDGTWLIENGKISKPVKNFRFTESPLFALNNIEQIGIPKRVFHPGSGWTQGSSPVIVPALKVRDFSFTALSDAI